VDLLTRETGAGPKEQRRASRWWRNSERFALLGVWAIVVVLFGYLRPDTFLTSENFQTILGSQSVLAVLTLALLPPLLAGDYDLSVASMQGLSAMTIGVLNVQHGWPIGAAIALALALGGVVGLVNGFFVVYLGVNSLIATLGSGTILSGIVLWISNSFSITGISAALVNAVVTTKIFSISLVFYYAVGLAGLMWYVFEYTALGRRLLFVGRSRTVSRLSGVRVGRIRVGALVVSGTVAAFAGALYVGTTGAADPTSSNSFLLPAFAAAFLGATCIKPGRFNPVGALIAVYFLVTGITGLQLLGAQSYVQDLFYGGALLAGVGASQLIAGRVPKETT
jgi:ribose transport system permease protein